MEDHIVEGTLVSCIRRDDNGNIIFPIEMRNQNEIHPGSCLHHALCPAIEGLHLQKWEEEGDPKAMENLAVYVGYLIRVFPPPISIPKMLNGILSGKDDKDVGKLGDKEKQGDEETVDGRVRDETLGFDNFKITGYTACDVDVNKGAEDLHKVYEHLRAKKPAIGIFSTSRECKPGRNKKIFVGNNQRSKVNCPICKRLIPSGHIVCLTGTADAYVDGLPREVFEYIESDNPAENSPEGDGICYMTVDTMEQVYLIHID